MDTTRNTEAAPRLSLPLTAEGYAQANEAFRQCWTADRAEVLAFLRAHPPHTDAADVAVLGVGVGDGAFDLPLITLLRELVGDKPIAYVAVEPNAAQLDGFRTRIATAQPPQVAFTLHQQSAEDFVPERQFDLIHYIHSLYHMPGSEAQLVGAASAQLRPSGRLLVALSSEQGGIYQMMQRFWNLIDYSFFTGGLFGQESLRAVLDASQIAYDHELYPDVAIDVSSCFAPTSEQGQHLLNFLLQADMQRAPDALRQQALDALRDLAQVKAGRQLLPHPSGVFVTRAA